MASEQTGQGATAPETFAPHNEQPYTGDEKVGPRSIRHLLDENRDLKEEYRHPSKALEIVGELIAPPVIDSQPSLLDAAQTILQSEYTDACVSDRESVASRDRRYTFHQEVYDRFSYVVSGLSFAVSDMLKLAGRQKDWKIDPSGKIMQAATGCDSKSKLCDAYFILRMRIAKAVDLLRHRTALHCGREHSEAPSLTASEASTQWQAGTERQVIDHHLMQPRLHKMVTPEYDDVLNQRRVGHPHAGQHFARGPGTRYSKATSPDSPTINLRLIIDQASRDTPREDRPRGESGEPSPGPPRDSPIRPSTPADQLVRQFTAHTPLRRAPAAMPTRYEGSTGPASTGAPIVRAPPPHFAIPHSQSYYATQFSGQYNAAYVPWPPKADPRYGGPPQTKLTTQRPASQTRLYPPAANYGGPRPYPQQDLSAPLKTEAASGFGGYQPARGGTPPLGNTGPTGTGGESHPPPPPEPSHGPPRGGGGGGGGGGNGGGGGGSGGGGGGPPPSRPITPTPPQPPYPPPPPPPGGGDGGGGGGDGGGGGGWPPRGPIRSPDNQSHSSAQTPNSTPRFENKYERKAVPFWNGSTDTLIDWLHDMGCLASINAQMSRDLASITPQRLTGYAREWWTLLPAERRRYFTQDWPYLRAAIIQHFITSRFLEELQDTYDRQRFRQKGHEGEEPIAFVSRRLRYYRVLYEEDAPPDQEIAAVFRNAPPVWATIINPRALSSVDALLQQVNECTPQLVQLTGLINSYDEGVSRRKATPPQSRSASPRRFRAPNRRAYATTGIEDTQDQNPEHAATRTAALEAASLGLVLPEGTPDDLFPPPLTAFANVVRTGPKGAGRRRPASYFHPVDDSVVSKTLPPSPCKVCGSAKHWDRECPHWDNYIAARAGNQATVEFDVHPSEDSEYACAYLESNRSSISALPVSASDPASCPPR